MMFELYSVQLNGINAFTFYSIDSNLVRRKSIFCYLFYKQTVSTSKIKSQQCFRFKAYKSSIRDFSNFETAIPKLSKMLSHLFVKMWKLQPTSSKRNWKKRFRLNCRVSILIFPLKITSWWFFECVCIQNYRFQKCVNLINCFSTDWFSWTTFKALRINGSDKAH